MSAIRADLQALWSKTRDVLSERSACDRGVGDISRLRQWEKDAAAIQDSIAGRTDELHDIVLSIPLLTSVVERRDGRETFYHTRCLYCGNVIDNGKCGEASGRDTTVTVEGHANHCLYKRALAATLRRF